MILPENSKISISTDRSGYPVLVFPTQNVSMARYGGALFLMFWLCGWAIGWVMAARALFMATLHPVNYFLMAWLGMWTIGGAAAIRSLFCMLRRPVPETMTFANNDIIYDSGRQPFQYAYRNRMIPRGKEFGKRKVFTFPPQDLATVELRETDAGNRLTIDQGNERVDIGRGLTEVEREWLHKEIKQRYKV